MIDRVMEDDIYLAPILELYHHIARNAGRTGIGSVLNKYWGYMREKGRCNVRIGCVFSAYVVPPPHHRFEKIPTTIGMSMAAWNRMEPQMLFVFCMSQHQASANGRSWSARKIVVSVA